eukprot:6184701-Pleurochrysis_carterae.AAC.2
MLDRSQQLLRQGRIFCFITPWYVGAQGCHRLTINLPLDRQPVLLSGGEIKLSTPPSEDDAKARNVATAAKALASSSQGTHEDDS